MLSLLAACSTGRGEVQCSPDTTYPFAGDWQPLDADDEAFCFQQARPDVVTGTHGGGRVVGVVNADGTLYVTDERFPVTVRVMTVSGDTLSQTAFVTSTGKRTETQRWVSRP